MARRDERDTLEHFYDWLRDDQGIHLCRYGSPKERTLTCPRCRGTGIDGTQLTDRQRQLASAGALKEEDWPQCPRCEGRRKIIEEYVDENTLFPIRERPEELFARFFDIDLEAFHDEKDAMLAYIREQNEKRDKAGT